VHAPAVPSVTSPRTTAVTPTAVRASVAISQPQLVVDNNNNNNLDSSDDEDDSDDDDEIFSGGLESTGGLVMGASPSLNPRQLDLYYQTLQKARNSETKKFGTTTTLLGHAPSLSVNLLEERSLTTPRPLVDSALEREVEALSRRSRGGEVLENMNVDNVVAIVGMAGEEEEEEEEEEENDKINGHRQPSYSSSGGGGGGISGAVSGGVGAILSPLPVQPNTPTARVPINLTPTQLALFRRTLAPTSSPSALLNAHLHSAGAKTSDLRRMALSQSTRRGISSSSSSSSSYSSSLPSPHLMTVSSLALDDLALASLRDESGGTIDNDDDDENDKGGGGDKRDDHRISSSSEMRYIAMSSSSIRGTPTLGKSAMRAATQSAARTEASATHASSPSLLDQQKQQKKAGIDSSLDMSNVYVESFSTSATYRTSPYTKSAGSGGGGGGFESPINIVLRNSHDQSEFSSSSSSRQSQEFFPLSSPMRVASSSSSSSKYESSNPSHVPLSSNSFSSARNNSSSKNADDFAEKSSFVTSNVSPSPPPSVKSSNNGNDPEQSLDDFASLLVSPNRMQTANVNLHGSSVETRFQAMLDAKFKQIGGDEDDL